MPGWVRPYLIGILSTVLVTGSVLLLSRPASPAIEVLIATPSAGTITVAISGEVARPGLYTLPPGRRVADLIERAGGATERADPATPSRALLLRDEMHIHVLPAPVSSGPAGAPLASAPPLGAPAAARPAPGAAEVAGRPGATPATAGEVTAPTAVSPTPAMTTPPAGAIRGETPAASVSPPGPAPAAPAGPINVNTASAADLEQLPGIGTVLAGRIVADRERNGPFRRVDDLERVSGIGPTLLARLRPLVTV